MGPAMATTSPKACLSVCVADDDPDLRSLLTKFVESLGHRVVCAVEDGRALVEADEHYDIDLMIVDFDMPVLDGLAAAEELSKTHPMPIIMISGFGELENAVWEHEPVSAWLKKPVTYEALRDAIQKVTQR